MNEKWREFANEYVVSLFPTYMLPEGLFEGTKKWLKQPVHIALKIENEAIVWYFQPENWKQGHLALVKKIRKNPQFLSQIYRHMESQGKIQIVFAKEAARAATTAGAKQLNALYQKFVTLNTLSYSYGLMLPLLDYQDTTFLADELHNILKKRGQDKHFNLLTIPQRETHVKKQELALLKLYALMGKTPGLKRRLQALAPHEFLAWLRAGHKKLSALLDRHVKDFCWVYYVYQGPAAGPEYFIDLMKDLAERKIDPQKELARHAAEKRSITQNQKQVFAGLGLDAYEKAIVLLAREGVFYKALRRELQSCSYFYMEPVLKAIGKRLGLSLRQVRLMLAKEIGQSLKGGRADTELLNCRARMVFLARAQKTLCLCDQAAAEYLKANVKREKINLDVSAAAGTVAYPGKARGVVKIINTPKEMGKMQRGDILVAQTTNPNLMPAIRLAKAIVTDEGGLTCHAAIVSRELKIPCVVGTKIASKFLKDGDKIEVNAKTGKVTKL